MVYEYCHTKIDFVQIFQQHNDKIYAHQATRMCVQQKNPQKKIIPGGMSCVATKYRPLSSEYSILTSSLIHGTSLLTPPLTTGVFRALKVS